MRILVVETDHAVRDRVKVAFQQLEGCTVDTAEDSWALELAKESPYDAVVIADTLQAPGDGLQLLKDLRAGGLTGPVVLLSHPSSDAAPKDREGVNASAVLTVPPDTLDIFKAVLSVQARVSTPQYP